MLALYLGEEEFPTNPVSQKALFEGLTSRPDIRVDYFGEFLESERFSDEVASQTLQDYIRAKYRGRRIDLVIAMTDSVLQFALDHRAELFPEAPIVFTALQVPAAPILSAGPGATGIRVSNAHAETLKLALDLHPSARQAFIVAHSPNERSIEIIRNELSRSSPHAKLTFINEGNVPRLLAAVRRVPSDSVIMFVWNSQDEPGNIKYSDDFARLVAGSAQVPVYGTNDLYIGSGVVGGVVRDTSETATRMAHMALEILAGKRAQDIPIEDARIVPTFDWRRFGNGASARPGSPADPRSDSEHRPLGIVPQSTWKEPLLSWPRNSCSSPGFSRSVRADDGPRRPFAPVKPRCERATNGFGKWPGA